MEFKIPRTDDNCYNYSMLFFKKAAFRDASQIARLVNSAYRGESSQKGWTTEEHLLDGLRTNTNKIKEMIDKDHIEIALDGDKQIVGCVYLEKRKDVLYLGMLTVRPLLQTQGAGKALLAQAEIFAKTHDIHKIKMTVIDSRSELIAFYERRGYIFTGQYEPFPTNDPVFGISKVGSIRFKVFEKNI